ncbi:4Fe-4S dicluster domain-containing protein [Geothrix sp. 21YS21S-4]|uniref:4Fe-4S dicluster domain-containing protein n=1 Tax=Geothrix sp. 21YS21S-4 TaxID=3068889 RepID=UPI0027BB129B|nr:4Fe-4S dicluster domain-containing protein [Geothrix sp. 21YS21S-4]
MTQKKAMLIDISLCIGCNACQDGCKTENKLKPGEEKRLSPSAYTALSEHDGVFVRHLCQHCDVPTCVSVCPVSAFTKLAEGPVLYDASKCIGCRYCMQACPFHVPRYEWASTKPRIQKCIFCAPRITKGLQPACAEACPTGATLFGDRDELLQEARKRISAEPAKFVPKIYGTDEVGGTSILYISPVAFEKLGFDTQLEKSPMPVLTNRAMSKIPNVVTVGSVMLAGIWWITSRRADVQRYEASQKQENRPQTKDKP